MSLPTDMYAPRAKLEAKKLQISKVYFHRPCGSPCSKLKRDLCVRFTNKKYMG